MAGEQATLRRWATIVHAIVAEGETSPVEQEDVGATFTLLREALPIDRDDETLLLATRRRCSRRTLPGRYHHPPTGRGAVQPPLCDPRGSRRDSCGRPARRYAGRRRDLRRAFDGCRIGTDSHGSRERGGRVSPARPSRGDERIGNAGRCLVRTSQPPTWPVTSARHRRAFADQGDRTGRQRNGRHRRRAGVADRCLCARGCRIRRDEGGSGGRVVDRRLDSTVAGIRGRRSRRCSGSVGMVGSGERSAFGTSLAYRPGPRPRLRSRRSHHGGARSVLRAARRTRHVWARVRGDPALQR